ncbi:hypothetical protein GCM10009641_52070 [Mycobacterium cookii]|uniref:Uncharacterized protein n=1 Tax=Mycobacterium cookii TaxID=1775 RepID=A0A7I7KU12_9MYCO|nr:hypothetical protein [Mycobacterium cookii]MCV7329099.1 hypothetical protein [Mycobacterium cookii]BBX45595.1 hypothetical protein MCOO_16100 [Mycobacterium cookii]
MFEQMPPVLERLRAAARAEDRAHTQASNLNRSAMMPKRRRTRAQNRADYIASQRRRNRAAREAARPLPIVANDEPPPF